MRERAAPGSAGTAKRAGRPPFTHDEIFLRPVGLSLDEMEEYYEEFSNDTLWPIYHDVIVQPSFHRTGGVPTSR